MKQRLAPFLDLLDARYLPLLAVVAPQAWTVYAWLLRDGSPPWVATLGGLGYEAVYVGAVAWAERGAGWASARPPAVTALLFSVAVAVAYYAPTVGTLAVLHAGFPVVAYAYTVTMHAHHTSAPESAATPTMVQAVQVNVSAPESATVTVERPALADESAPLSKTAKVKRLAAERGVAESTAWRKVNAGEWSI